MQTYHDILLPVETTARELDAKLLLALFAADAGFAVHIGTLAAIQSPGFPPSIYLSKSVRFTKSVQIMARFGHAVVAWDEEGLVRFKDEKHGNRIEKGALQIPRLLLSWGPDNARMWKAHAFYDGRPIAETGNPRIDLLRPELRTLYANDVADLVGRFGDFALLNTNFAIINHFRSGGRRIKASRNSHDSQAFIEFRDGLENHKRALLKAFLAALPTIAQGIKPFRLIVRPHPSESPVPWQEAAKGLDNVTVLLEATVVPWLLAAKCLIHNGCTSAVEASVVKTPALAYCPFENLEYDLQLPNALSEKLVDVASLVHRARQLLEAGRMANQASAWPMLLQDNISALDGPLASQRIVQELLKLRDSTLVVKRSALDMARAYGKYAFKAIRRQVSPGRRGYEEHKSNALEFNKREIEKKVETMSRAIGKFGNQIVTERSPGIVTITAPN
ncbi:MAG: hypothetical protein K8F25_16900 [Fimbriimonadaceae bacterium]|nr:hypothetical protein [Alphaproteobacteria bacterium]